MNKLKRQILHLDANTPEQATFEHLKKYYLITQKEFNELKSMINELELAIKNDNIPKIGSISRKTHEKAKKMWSGFTPVLSGLKKLSEI